MKIEKKNIFFNNKKISVVAPLSRSIDICYYCQILFGFEEVNFNFEKDKNFSDYILVDMTRIDFLYKIKNPTKYNYIIIFWNGSFDLRKYEEKFIEAKDKLNINLYFFIVGSFFKNKKNYYNSDNFKINNQGKIKIYNLDNKTKLKYLYPSLYSIFRMLKYPSLSLSYFFKPKVIFMGFGIIDNKEIEFYKNRSNENKYEIFKNKVWNFLSNNLISNEHIDRCINFMKKINSNEEFNKLETFEKYTILQNIFRHTFIIILKNYKNFEWIRRDGKLFFYQSPFFKKNVYVDFGSKCEPNYIYSRTLYLNKFNKKTLYVNFFKDISNENTDFDKNISESVNFLKIINTQKNEFMSLKTVRLVEYLKNSLILH